MSPTAGGPEGRSDAEPFVVELERFQGPLELLLHLIRSQDIDIFDIPIARITAQFQAALEAGLDRLELDRAGEFVEMDPQSWDLNMDVTVSVGLGSGMTDQKLNTLIQIAEKQEAQLQAGSPLVGFREYRNTLSRITKLAGFEQDTEFWKPFGEEEEQAFQQQQAQAAQEPTTEEQLVKVEMAKIQQKHAEAMAKLQLEAQKMSLEDDRKRDEIVRDFETKLAELGVEIEESQLQAARDALDADLDRADKELGIIERLANIELGGSSGQESS